LVIPAGSGVRELSLAHIDGLETLFAMTIHKSQGSQFDAVTVVIPGPTASLTTRELLYTGVTRAKQRVRLIGTRAAIVQAITHPALRASGLKDRLGATLTKPHQLL
jgi:exodeoxyribonuclease V alpha subunit